MTKNVIKTMLWLVIGYLVTWYILKIFFPDIFLLQINNERLIAIGDFIDKHFILDKLLGLAMSYITYSLYLGALCEFKFLNLKQSLIVCGVYVANRFCDNIVIMRVDGHLTVAMYSQILDIWDCSDELVDVYWLIK